MNYNWLTERIAVGSRPRSQADLFALRKEGVTHVLDVCEYDDSEFLLGMIWGDPGLPEKYCWNPSRDDGVIKPAGWFYTSIAFGSAALATHAKKLYVHCFDGINRGPSTAYAIMRDWGLTHGEARLILLSKRPIAMARYTLDADAAIAAATPQ